jgi:hypothetical protein
MDGNGGDSFKFHPAMVQGNFLSADAFFIDFGAFEEVIAPATGFDGMLYTEYFAKHTHAKIMITLIITAVV